MLSKEMCALTTVLDGAEEGESRLTMIQDVKRGDIIWQPKDKFGTRTTGSWQSDDDDVIC